MYINLTKRSGVGYRGAKDEVENWGGLGSKVGGYQESIWKGRVLISKL